jgi:hypothetical protein
VAEPIDYSSVSNLDQPRAHCIQRLAIPTGDTANPLNDHRLHISHRTALSKVCRTAGAAIFVAGATACGDTLRGAGPNPALAETHADQLFDAVSTRFNQVELAPKYDAARVRLAQSALVPSRIFDDTVVWEARPSAALRLLYVSGTMAANGHYRLEPRPTLTPPTRPGDTRHTIALELLAPSVYRWDTNVELGIGAISAEEVSVLLSTLFRAAEGRTEKDLRDDYRTAFPRATTAFGHGFSIDSLRATPSAVGATSVVVTGGFHPELMRPSYPALASYLDKYLGPAKYHFALADRSGAPLLDVAGRDRSMTIRYRVSRGQLVNLVGAPRSWPDSLVLTSDVSLKVKVFTVGFHHLVTNFAISNTGHDRSWTVIAQKEPGWDLPLLTERLLRTPLRRPFEGAGSLFRIGVRDSAGMQSVFVRRTRLDVQESAIMRFVGSLASHAVGDLNEKVEVEEDRFLHDGFAALQADTRALGGRWRAEGGGGLGEKSGQK